MTRALVLGALAMVALGCPSRSKEPSAEYEQARTRFTKLYGEKLDEAFLDPRMQEVEALLAKVPADSLDAEAAKQLQGRIDEGQARMGKAKQEVADAIAKSDSMPPSFPTPTESPVEETVDAGAAAEVVDAGPSSYPRVGMPASELASRFGQCFRIGQTVQVPERGMLETWQLKDMQMCATKFPAFTSSVIVIDRGAILAIVPASDIRTEDVYPDGGTAAPKR